MQRDNQNRANSRRLWQYSWEWIPGSSAISDPGLIANCARLFSTDYGTWGPTGLRPGERIVMTDDRVRALLVGDDVWLATASYEGELVGYCIALRSSIPDKGRISWITQLVVAAAHRQFRIATKLLYSIWGFSDDYAWGLVTANPFAVRALETATRRPCRTRVIGKEGPELAAHINRLVPYIPAILVEDEAGRSIPRVDTGFGIDLSRLPEMLKSAGRRERPWRLGRIAPGQEWFACTFRSQIPDAIDEERMAELLAGADDVWVHAYEGMTLDEQHRWRRHTESEIEWILDATQLHPGNVVLDVGCGDGRHAIALANRGYRVRGVDLSQKLVESASTKGASEAISVTVGDAREGLPRGPFPLAILLYDVLGTSGNTADDRLIIRNIFNVLDPGGMLVASVMNTRVTGGLIPQQQLPASRGEFLRGLEELSPSRTMETTGDVFDPNLLLVYEGVHYRKEQFAAPGKRLPGQLLVRDKRYSPEELTELVSSVGFNVLRVIPVQAGSWDREPPLEETHPNAKELLIQAEKPS